MEVEHVTRRRRRLQLEPMQWLLQQLHRHSFPELQQQLQLQQQLRWPHLQQPHLRWLHLPLHLSQHHVSMPTTQSWSKCSQRWMPICR